MIWKRLDMLLYFLLFTFGADHHMRRWHAPGVLFVILHLLFVSSISVFDLCVRQAPLATAVQFMIRTLRMAISTLKGLTTHASCHLLGDSSPSLKMSPTHMFLLCVVRCCKLRKYSFFHLT